MRVISPEELAKHNTEGDCWVAIHGKVWDLTSFLEEHPAGSEIIMKNAGKDGTAAFDPFHSASIVSTLLEEDLCKGTFATIDLGTPAPAHAPAAAPAPVPAGAPAVAAGPFVKPPLEAMMNVFDFAGVAQTQMGQEGWDYYSSGADDEVTMRENHGAFQRVWLKPRILVDVEKVDMSTSLLGDKVSMPLYITATALGKLAHPEGEVVLTRAAYEKGIVQMIPTLASCSLEELTDAAQPGQIQWFQLYVNKNRAITKKIIQKAEKRGCKALFITVDAPQLGRRERDMRNKVSHQGAKVQQGSKVNKKQGTARAISSFIDPSLSWKDLPWFRSVTKMKIFLKGVQCGEDAVLAYKAGMDGIVLSNHGGRQLDFCRSAIEILPEVMTALRQVGGVGKLAVYIDGGIRRGTDIFKALALGATAVGIGRPALYGMAAYGQDGVEKVVDLLRDELEMTMRLMGAPTIADITPDMVMTQNLTDHFVMSPQDNIQYGPRGVYIPMSATVPRSRL